MSCGSLTTGFDFECQDGLGGIKEGTLVIAQWDDIASYTSSDGVVTAITQDASTYFYEYQVRKFIPSNSTTATSDLNTGTVPYVSTFTFMLFKMDNEKNVQLQLLASKPIVAIYRDNNNVYHAIGLSNGADVTQMVSQTGKEAAEMNGYTITITSTESHFPLIVQSSVYDGLTVSGNLS